MNKDILSSFGNSAPEITHFLSDYGNGSMKEGIRKIAANGYKKGFLGGATILSLAIVTAYGIYKLVDINKQKINKKGENIMAQYKLIFDGEEQDEIFNSEEDAEEYAAYLRSCARDGAETLNMSNPGDYDYDEDEFESPEYEII